MRGGRVRSPREAKNWVRQDLADKLQVSLDCDKRTKKEGNTV